MNKNNVEVKKLSELKKCCRYCSNFRDHTCQLEPFKIEYTSYFCSKKFDSVDFERLKKQIVIKDPDDFCCKYYT